MKKLLLLFLLLSSSFLFSQNNYEKGYFINNNNEKIECLIKNLDWLNNPSDFQYKLSEEGELQTGNIKYIKYFEVYDKTRYVRATVQIDLSPTNLSDLTSTRNPILEEKELFLKEIVSGSANLYIYRQSQIEKFFYSLENGVIQPLIHKSYYIQSDKIAYNNDYQQELFNNLICSDITLSQIKTTNYKEKDLSKLFDKYNRCKNPEMVNKNITKNKGEFNITIRPRVNFTKSEFTRASTPYDFGKKTIIGLGIDLEYVLPFNNKKWSVFTDPNYIDVKSSTNVYKSKIDFTYKAIEVPIGIRYGIFLSKNSKLYLNAAYVIDVNLNSKLTRDNADFIEVKSLPNFAFGLGYRFKDRYSIELRSATSKDMTKSYMYWTSEFTNTSIILGYRIF